MRRSKFVVPAFTPKAIPVKRVLDVGQCAPDHASIRRLVEGNFEAAVVQAHGLDDMLAHLEQEKFDLVLVNRKLDADDSDGLEIIKRIKNRPEMTETPVMMVTNYAQHQQTAVAAGAEPGFGKQQLRDPATLAKLARFLS